MSPDPQTLSTAAAFNAAAVAAGSAPSPRAFLRDAIEHLSRLHAADQACILLVEEDRLVVGASIGLPEAFVAAVDGIRYDEPSGTCGSAVQHGTPQVTRDILTDERWAPFRELTEEHGIRACWSVPLRVSDGSVLGTFAVYHAHPYQPTPEELELAGSYATVVALGLDRLSTQSHLAASYEAVVVALSSALDARDEYTGQHSSATAELAALVAERLGLTPGDAAIVRQVAVLHDVGKLGVPSDILRKSGPLSAEEKALMREHPVIGERILSGVPHLGEVALAIRHEHERWDGGGYPDGLAGEQIPLASRIVFACDAWHAMTSNRPYRAAMDEKDALQELREHAGAQFDPRVAQALLEVLGDESPGGRDLFSPRETHERAQAEALTDLAAEIGADDLFVFRRVAAGIYSHLSGVGRGAGWAGNIEVDSAEETHVRDVLDRREPLVVALAKPGRIVGPYYGRSAVLVPCEDETIVIFGSASDALAGADLEIARSLGERARGLVVDVSPAKRLADELEVLAAVRAITTVSSDSMASTLAAIAGSAAEALSCEYGAIMTLPTDGGEPVLGWADRGWTPDDPDAALGALAHYTEHAHELPMLCQDTAAAVTDIPAGFRREDGASSVHVLPVGNPAVAMLLVVHAEPGLRGFTALCQRVARAMSDASEVVVRRAQAQERLAAENAELTERLRTDTLTGVASRAAWEETIRTEELHHSRSGQPLAVVVLDLDELKVVNDREGHAAGDALLRDAARVLAETTRATDVVARIGGDEFGVLLRYTDGEHAKVWCARLEERLLTAGQGGRAIACSLGCASVAPESTLADALVEADRRMYVAKAASRRGRSPR